MCTLQQKLQQTCLAFVCKIQNTLNFYNLQVHKKIIFYGSQKSSLQLKRLISSPYEKHSLCPCSYGLGC